MGRARDYYIENRVARIEWRLSVVEECMVCGWLMNSGGGFQWLETHEIERRSAAPTRWADPCNYLLVCNQCHSERITLMSHAEQLAVKWKKDKQNFNLEDWLRLRDPDLRAPHRVTLEEIGEYL
jgi:hypothetical protein